MDAQQMVMPHSSGTRVVDPVLTYDELAPLLHMNRRSLERLVARNKIPHKKVGRRVLFYWPRIVEWLQHGDRR